MAKKLEDIPIVDIDPEGVFKYIQIKVTDKKDKSIEKILVRGYGRHAFHGDIFEEVEETIGRELFKLKCLGGGRISRDSSKKLLDIYGYSQAYGPAKHEVTKELLQKVFPDYQVSFSNDGY